MVLVFGLTKVTSSCVSRWRELTIRLPGLSTPFLPMFRLKLQKLGMTKSIRNF